MKMVQAKFNITIEDRVILHLLNLITKQDDFEVSYDTIQHGIAEAVSIRRAHVSYILKSLKTKGLVTDRLAHVKNITRKRKSYFLTPDGKKYALRLRENISKKTIIYIDKSGKTKSLKLSELQKEVPSPISIGNLINSINTNSEIHYAELVDKRSSTSEMITDSNKEEFISSIDTMAHPARFVGRNHEIENIKKLIEKELPKCIVIKGIAGIGKTTLMAKIIEEYVRERNKNLFWFKIHEWDSIRSTLVELTDFLSQLNRKKLKFYIDGQPNLELPEIMKLLEDDLQSENVLMVFDDLQKANEGQMQLFKVLIELLESEKLPNLKIIILTRDSPKFYDRRNVAIRKLIAELDLTGLDLEASKQLLNVVNIKESQFNKIYEITEGHPLSLELIGIQITSENTKGKLNSVFDINDLFSEQHDINKYLREEIFQKLSEPEKKLLENASVFRYPVPSNAILVEKNTNYESIDSLVEKSLLLETTSGFDLHELIKEFFYRRLTPQQQIQKHKQAAKYYSNELTELDGKIESVKDIPKVVIEAQYHNLRARDFPRAGELAVEYGETLVGKGFTDEFNSILSELDSKKVSYKTWAEILIHKGFILTITGEWDNALKLYQESLRWCKKNKDRSGLARANNGIGIIHYRKGELKSAQEFFTKGLEFAKAKNDKKNSAKLYSNIALVHWCNGELESAIELNKKSLRISTKLTDKYGIARAHNNLGIIYWEQRKLTEAIKEYNKSLKLSEELGDIRTIAILYDNLGEAYRLKGKENKAQKFYKKSLQLSKELGFKWQIAEVNCNLGILFAESDSEKSRYYLNSALEMYKYLGASREVERVKKILGGK
jgi:tetratricopeptide (TPR) repeat protein/DNA-binding MarR family transcriptional regulator